MQYVVGALIIPTVMGIMYLITRYTERKYRG